MGMSVDVLGIRLGTATGWDQVTDHGVMFYDFEPIKGLVIKKGALYVDMEKGNAEIYDDAGEPIQSLRALDLLTAADTLDKAHITR